MSKRVALGLRYDGARYHGWQMQETVNTVQLQVERALSFVANHAIHVNCAGRTDAGVHATSQVIHFDIDAERLAKSWVFVPIVSVGSVRPMTQLSDESDWCDNVLLEWTAALELHQRGRVKSVLPLLAELLRQAKQLPPIRPGRTK